MIDPTARAALAQRSNTQQLTQGITQIVEALKQAPVFNKVDAPSTPASDLVDQLKSLQKTIGNGNLIETMNGLTKTLDSFEVSEQALGNLKSLVADLSNKLKVMAEIEAKIPSEVKMNFPKEFPVKGTVDIGKVNSLPPVKISNMSEFTNSLGGLIESLRFSIAKASEASKQKFPDSFSVSNEVRISQFSDLLDGIEELKKGFNILINQDNDVTKGTSGNPTAVSITNFPPQMVPQPVTNINVNALRGYAQTTAVTLTATPVPLPGTALAYRRTLIIYNNSSNTVYIGGSNVTTSNGLPIAASSFSPAIDAGARMLVYGVAASSSEVRVMEVSNDADGG